MQQFMHLFRHRWNTIKVMKSHILEISGMQPMLSESNFLPNVNQPSASDYISLYFSSAAKFSFFFFAFIRVQDSWRPQGADVVFAVLF